MKYNALILMIVAIAALSCNTSTDSSPGLMYPLNAGNVWNYDGTFAQYNFRPEQDSIIIPDKLISWKSKVEILGKEILRDSVQTTKFVETEVPYIGLGYYYFIQNQDTLCEYAYHANASLIVPKQLETHRFTIHGFTFDSYREMFKFFETGSIDHKSAVDSLIYNAKPAKVHVYPLKVGSEWNYREPGYPWLLRKKIVGVETVTVPAGTFVTFKIQFFWDFNSDGIWDTFISGFEYVCDIGIVKRTFLYTDVPIMDGVSGPSTPIGYADMKQEYVLTSVNIR